MEKAKVILEEIFLSLAIAVSFGTWAYANSFVCGENLIYILQSFGPAILWLGPSYALILLLQLLLKKSAELTGESQARGVTIKYLRPFYICLLAFLNPLISYFFFGLCLIILVFLWISLRRLAVILSTESGKLFSAKAEKLLTRDHLKYGVILAGAVFIFYLLIISGVFAELPQPEGDEPHYLTTAYSMLTDGDLQLADNYQAQEFRLWHAGWIQAHTKAGKNGMVEQYSMHNIGLSIYLIPFLQAGLWFNSPEAIHFFVRLGMIILASLYICMLFLLLLRLSGRGLLSLGISVLVALSSPVLFFSYHCFTEIAAALVLIAAFYILWRKKPPALLSRILLGTLLGILPWLGVKYFLLAATFVALWIVKEIEWKFDFKKAALVAIPGILLALFFFWQTYDLFGTFSPSAYYMGADLSVSDNNIVFKTAGTSITESITILSKTVLSYFIDQREGLLFYAPWYLLGIAGLMILLFSKETEERKLAFWLLVLSLPFIILYGLTGFGGGHSPPTRSLMPVLFIFIIPALSLIKKGLGLFKEVFLVLVFISLAISLILVLNPNFLYHDFHVQASHIISWLSSPALNFQEWFPSINSKHFENWPVSFAWLGLWLLLAGASIHIVVKKPARKTSLTCYGLFLPGLLLVSFSLFTKVPPTIDQSFPIGDTGSSIAFSQENVFIDQDGFWVKTASRQSCYFFTAEKTDKVNLRVRTLTPNTIQISNGARIRELRLVKKLNSNIPLELPGGFIANGFYVNRFSVFSESGNPQGLLTDNGDSRPLGLEVRIKPEE